jgi:hypothetical protein
MRHETEDDGANEQAVAEFMSRVAALPPAATLPDPSYVWWNAELLRRQDAQRRVMRPIEMMQPVQIAAGVIAAVWLFYSSLWPLFGS